MQQFYKFENKEDITTSDVKFSFNNLNEIYTKTDKKTFTEFYVYIRHQY